MRLRPDTRRPDLGQGGGVTTRLGPTWARKCPPGSAFSTLQNTPRSRHRVPFTRLLHHTPHRIHRMTWTWQCLVKPEYLTGSTGRRQSSPLLVRLGHAGVSDIFGTYSYLGVWDISVFLCMRHIIIYARDILLLSMYETYLCSYVRHILLSMYETYYYLCTKHSTLHKLI